MAVDRPSGELKTESGGPRLVERALDILTALSDGPKTFTVICQKVGLSKGTVHRILIGLSYSEFVVQVPESGEYMLGPGCYRMARGLIEENGGIAGLVRPVLQALWEGTEETVILHVRVGASRVCIAELQSPRSLRYTAGIGSSAPLHVGAAGKVLLAWFDDAQLRKILPDSLGSTTEATITDFGVLREELEHVRRQGWAESHGERVQGAFAISAPIFDDRHHVAASVSVLGPEVRLTRTRFIELRRELVETAARASALLGAPEDGGGHERAAPEFLPSEPGIR
jgi:DNA-binding IclR family transcriptional regulator